MTSVSWEIWTINVKLESSHCHWWMTYSDHTPSKTLLTQRAMSCQIQITTLLNLCPPVSWMSHLLFQEHPPGKITVSSQWAMSHRRSESWICSLLPNLPPSGLPFQDHIPSIALLTQNSSTLEDLNSNHGVSPLCSWDNCVNIYAPYELTAINNVMRDTDIHTFHPIAIWLWTNMSATLHIYFPLHYYCSLHIDPHIICKSKSTNYKF